MLGWVITCHDELAQEMLDRLEQKVWSAGPVPGGQLLAQSQQQYVEPDDVRCAACHRLRGRVIFLTDKTGAAPYRAAALMSHKHTHCEVISGVSYPLLERMYLLRGTLSSVAFRQAIVSAGGPMVSSLWHQQQKNPPFRLRHDAWGN